MKLSPEYQRAWRAANVEAAAAHSKKYYLANQEARAAYKRSWYAENRERIRQKHAAWKRNNRDAVLAQAHRRLSGGTVSSEDIKTIRHISDHVCSYCLKYCKRLEIDHVQPLSRFGDHALDNLVGACRSCNGAKHAKTPLEFLCKLPKLG